MEASEQARAFVKVEEAAQFLGIGRQQAYAAVRSGEIPSIRIGKSWRIPVEALKQMASGQ
jgi:excisionase family DNA binding protein